MYSLSSVTSSSSGLSCLHPLFLCSSLYRLVAHDCCEVVLVTLCSVSRGVPEAAEDLKPCLGRVAPLAEHRFSFVQDLAFDMAQFLVSNNTRHFHFWVSGKLTTKPEACHRKVVTIGYKWDSDVGKVTVRQKIAVLLFLPWQDLMSHSPWYSINDFFFQHNLSSHRNLISILLCQGGGQDNVTVLSTQTSSL